MIHSIVSVKSEDCLFLLEHPNTYTLGKTAHKENLIGSKRFKRKIRYLFMGFRLIPIRSGMVPFGDSPLEISMVTVTLLVRAPATGSPAHDHVPRPRRVHQRYLRVEAGLSALRAVRLPASIPFRSSTSTRGVGAVHADPGGTAAKSSTGGKSTTTTLMKSCQIRRRRAAAEHPRMNFPSRSG